MTPQALPFRENHVFLTSAEEIEREFAGHNELIEEFKRRLKIKKLQARLKGATE
jgi:molybdopterin synthase catalytic subunit